MDSGQSLLVTSRSLTSQVWYLLLLCLRSHLLFHSLSFFQPLSISLMYFPWEGSDSLCKLFCKQSVFIWAVSRSRLSLLALHWRTDTFCIQATLSVSTANKPTNNHMLDSFLSLEAWGLTPAGYSWTEMLSHVVNCVWKEYVIKRCQIHFTLLLPYKIKLHFKFQNNISYFMKKNPTMHTQKKKRNFRILFKRVLIMKTI